MMTDYSIAQWALKVVQVGFLIRGFLLGGEESMYAMFWAILIQLWIMEG